MKPQPLNLNKIKSWVKQDLLVKQGDINRTIDLTINKTKQYLKSACMFWLKYKDNPVLLCREKPEYKKEFEPFATAFKSSSFSSQKLKWILGRYNDWLFKLVFKSVLEDDK